MSSGEKIMIVAGEASGDMHGARLVQAILKQRPELKIYGIGGDKMRQEGVELIYHIQEMSVLGILDVIKRFPFFRKVYARLVSLMKKEHPRLLILIDYPGMNLKLAKAAKELGIKVFYYIAPQVWAWGSGRIEKMVKIIDKMAVIIPFEEELFKRAGLDTSFVGHPLLEVLSTRISRPEFLKVNHINHRQKIIGLLPGSRVQEVRRLFPEMIRTYRLLKRRHPEVQALVGCAASIDYPFYEKFLDDPSDIKLLTNSTYEIMKYSDLLIVASGTATLESALFETPLIIVYKVDPLSYFIGKRLVKIKNIGLVNVIAERRIVPEFIQNQFQGERLLPTVEKLLFDKKEHLRVVTELKKIKQKLGMPGASQRAAEIALSL